MAHCVDRRSHLTTLRCPWWKGLWPFRVTITVMRDRYGLRTGAYHVRFGAWSVSNIG